jgi:homoserine O-succinyltransferase/O-acetyltransferase
MTLDLHQRRSGNRAVVPGDRWPLRIGFVNNMPDAAFEDTYRQFATLIRDASGGAVADLRCYYIPTVPRGAGVLSAASVPYHDVERLYRDAPDAVVITGTEPRSSDLTDEPYWAELSELLRWAAGTVPSTLLSCLASHAAALALDGIRRSRLPAKQTGVFEQKVDRTHPLARGMGAVASFPHSRFNEIPARALTASRYRLVVASPRAGWSVATRETADRLLILLQGHPEYSASALLKEYRRDVRRYLEGSNPSYPTIPQHYLDRTGEDLLEAFRTKCEGSPGSSGDDFPFQAAADHIQGQWDHTSRQLFVNWLADARLRTALVAS